MSISTATDQNGGTILNVGLGKLERYDREIEQDVVQLRTAVPEFQKLARFGRQQRDHNQRDAADQEIGRQQPQRTVAPKADAVEFINIIECRGHEEAGNDEKTTYGIETEMRKIITAHKVADDNEIGQ